MLQNNTEKNISRLYFWAPIIIIASKFYRWTFMLYSLIYMSIGWGMADRIAKGEGIWGGPGAGVLRNAEWFFYHINFLNIETFRGWEWFFSIVYNIAFIAIIIQFYKKNPFVGAKENYFIYLNLAVLNIFCFTMSKECYQVLFWFLLSWCILHFEGHKKKTIALTAGLVFTFIFARKYYALIALYFYVIEFYVNNFLSNIDTSTSKGRKRLIWNIVSLFAIFAIFHFFFMGFMSETNEDQYNEMVRVNTREGSGADSEIAPIFKGNRIMLTLDYFIKIFRLAIPIELLVKPKPTYLITIAYQGLLALFLYRAFKNRKKASLEDLEEEEQSDEELIEEESEEDELEEVVMAENGSIEPDAVSSSIALEESDSEEEEEDEEEDTYDAYPETRDRIDTRTIALYTYIAFLLCSAMFEPDFGSWLRHQCVALPVIICIL